MGILTCHMSLPDNVLVLSHPVQAALQISNAYISVVQSNSFTQICSPCPASSSKAAGVPQSYGNSRQAVEAVGSGVCLVDRSHWPRIRLTGRDRIPVLQRFTTQDFSNLTPGQGCDTVRQGAPLAHAVCGKCEAVGQ